MIESAQTPVINNWHCDEQDTLLHAMKRVLDVASDRILFDFSGEMVSYGEFDRITTRLAHSLRSLGVEQGHTVVSILDNNLDAVTVWFAVNKVGAIAVPVNTALKGEFLRHQLDDSQAAILICEADYLARVAEVAAGIPQVKRILCRGSVEHAPFGILVEPLDGHRGADETQLPIVAQPGDISCIIYTSGTTGPSKGSMQPYNFFCNLAKTRLRSAPATAEDITFSPMPLFHNNALATGIAGTMISGGRIAIVPRFSVSAFWPEIRRSGATIISVVGTMATLLAEAPDTPDSLACHGQIHTVRGVPFADRVKEAWRTRFGARLVGSNDYGMTEAAVVTWLAGGAHAAPNSSGKRFADFDVRIVDDDDIEVAPGEAGEIVIRPNKPNIMTRGYWRRPEATVAAMRNQWFHTGDIGRFDEDGFLYFVDRKKDYLKRRGENISSFEMEVALKAHPAILEVAVHAVPSAMGDDDVKVTAVLRPGETLSERDYCLWIAERVPFFAVPRFIEFRDALPKNPQDKVLKFKLREEGRTPATWDIETSGITIERR